MVSDSKITNKMEKLQLLETIVQDFLKEKPQYDHPDNPKFNKYNRKFNYLIFEADSLKMQGKIEELVRVYKTAISYSRMIILLHESIEDKIKNPRYYKLKKKIWLMSIGLLISLFIVMVLEISLQLGLFWLVNILLIAVLTMMVLGVKIFLKYGKIIKS
jgi:hypothetical protein